MKRSEYTRLIQIAAVAIALAVYYGLPHLRHQAVKQSADGSFFTVTRVVDGDTIALANGQKVRLIGVDTPELHESDKLARDARRSGTDARTIQGLGKEASRFTRELVLGKRVRLTFDVQKRDRYGRLLAYVWRDDGVFVNAKIIEAGYGQVMTIPPNVKYAADFLKAEEGARQNARGLWALDSYRALLSD